MSNSCSNGAAIQSCVLSQSCSGASSRHHLGYKLLVHNSLCMSRSSTCVWLKHYSHRRLVENALSLDDCKSMTVGSEVLPITLAHRFVQSNIVHSALYFQWTLSRTKFRHTNHWSRLAEWHIDAVNEMDAATRNSHSLSNTVHAQTIRWILNAWFLRYARVQIDNLPRYHNTGQAQNNVITVSNLLCGWDFSTLTASSCNIMPCHTLFVTAVQAGAQFSTCTTHKSVVHCIDEYIKQISQSFTFHHSQQHCQPAPSPLWQRWIYVRRLSCLYCSPAHTTQEPFDTGLLRTECPSNK